MIRFTRHAFEKFVILERHGVHISQNAVIAAVEHPDKIDYSRFSLKIAQRDFDKHHVLRVVYKEINENKVIITFYPGRKAQYAKP